MAQISQPQGVTATLLAKMLACGALGALACTPLLGAAADAATAHADPSRKARLATRPRPDLSGRARTGVASFYAGRFAGRKMADGNRMDPRGNNAASRTLPLGTVAKVTNLATHKSAVVTIQDRGPYVKGRIVDLSPSTARRIGITRKLGIGKVRVTPIVVPLPDGRIKLAGAAKNPQLRRSASAASTGGTTTTSGGA
jgi:rare lipoprotein A